MAFLGHQAELHHGERAEFFLTKILALYLSPVLGLENTSISEFRKELHGHGYDRETPGWNAKNEKDSIVDSVEVNRKSCEKMFSLDGFSVGMEFGGGLSLGRYFGLTGSILYEYNFVEAVQLTLTPGLAFDMRRVWAWPREKLRSMWISFEVGFQRSHCRRRRQRTRFDLSDCVIPAFRLRNRLFTEMNSALQRELYTLFLPRFYVKSLTLTNITKNL